MTTPPTSTACRPDASAPLNPAADASVRRGGRAVRLARLVVVVLAVLAVPSASAQTIYPDLTGDELTAALAASYTPTWTYSYDRARDTLFAVVHMERAWETGAPDDSLRGLYSGHAVPIDPDLDPTTAAWNSTPRYSTEHLWPENRGATEGTPAHSDMHHLAPVMQSVNSSRSDHPFGEVVDAEADRWWGPDGVTGTAMPPASVRDLYTEKLNASTASLLEPRESVKGDVARAMFYVWAVYGPSGADQLDAEFWALQQTVLLAWHEQDPADPAEIDRTLTVEHHQGTANPFVLDETLAARAFSPPAVQVALASFTAMQTSDGARIAWSTSAEVGVVSWRIDGRADVFGGPWTEWATAMAGGQPGDYSLTVPSLAVGTYRVALTAVTVDGDALSLGDVGLTIEPATSDETAPSPAVLTLLAPNPTRDRTAATLILPDPVHVLALVTDALGRDVDVPFQGPAVGTVQIAIDAHGLPPGVYVLRVLLSQGPSLPPQRFTVAR